MLGCFTPLEASETEQEAPELSVIERELDANEDPLSLQSVEIATATEETYDFSLYGSLRVRNRWTEAENVWEDFGSRVGLDGWTEFAPRQWGFARYELGFNLLEELDFDSLPSLPDQEFGDTVFTRLAYAGLQFDDSVVALGKNWSTYYQVAAFTDRFDSLGGKASGAFNAQTDGGASGTGRADQVLQGRIRSGDGHSLDRLPPLEVNVQMQADQEIPGLPGVEYEDGFGLSAIVEVAKGLELGFAYNHSKIDLASIPIDERNGINGDLSAWLLGARWFGDNWYLGATWSRSSNLHTTDLRTYFDGDGIEIYAQYQLFPDVWVLAGLNRLQPDSGQGQAENYLLEYGVLGVRYLFDGFSRMVYLESRIDSGRTESGLAPDDQIILGVRWGFDINLL